jgi:hypothetical protein
MRATKAITVCALALTSTFSSATAGYVTSDNGVLIIGQDTLTAVPQLHWFGHSCKMFVTDRYVLATAGNVADLQVKRDTSGKKTPVYETHEFDAIANSILKKARTPREIVVNLIKAIEDWKRSQWLNSSPENRQLFKSADASLGGTLIWFDGTKPMISSFYVTPVYNGNAIAFKKDNPPPMEIPNSTAGLDHMRQNALHDKEFMQTVVRMTDPVARVNKLLDKETELSGQFIGPPFTIFRLSPIGGSSWVGDASTCKDNSHLTHH